MLDSVRKPLERLKHDFTYQRSGCSLCFADEQLDGLKNSPHNCPGTPRDDVTPGNAELGFTGIHYPDGINPVRNLAVHYIRGFQFIFWRELL